ncbi:hypothetical protein CROQUDRAFT_653266 [Cronartium quercuum f. sp. fusiforme G11]|uniref:Uncharacterized protein n=1 Tax=Cronartium quercuum f. sp. fusiforme G11 TaxID=708437 RepID=A0A9P6TFA0_9BASI|nr:hypothetical protein CROQUDRAFT_653266 [Cronartium quercuum f. sp. fusiforme G11]
MSPSLGLIIPSSPANPSAIAIYSESLPDSPSASAPPTIDPETRAKVNALQRTAFLGLGPEDWPYIAQTSRLLMLRDQAPAVCAGEATVLMGDRSAARCWRARAAVYRAEALMRLGFAAEARGALVSAGRMLGGDWDEVGLDKDMENEGGRRESYETLEALVAWNVAMGKLNWGMIDGADEEEVSKQPIHSGSFLAAGWPLSHSLSALDLRWC